MIKASNIYFCYRKPLSSSRKVVFENFSAVFEDGKINAVSGANGSGKTTLAKIISGLITAEKGSLEIDGLKADWDDFPYEKVSILTQPQTTFYHQMSVADNLRFYGIDDYEYILMLCDMINFRKEMLYEKFSDLSSGNRVKAVIIKCLSEKRKNIIFDEPLSYLDKKSQDSFKDYIMSIKKEKCIIITSSNLNQIRDISDNYIEL